MKIILNLIKSLLFNLIRRRDKKSLFKSSDDFESLLLGGQNTSPIGFEISVKVYHISRPTNLSSCLKIWVYFATNNLFSPQILIIFKRWF